MWRVVQAWLGLVVGEGAVGVAEGAWWAESSASAVLCSHDVPDPPTIRNASLRIACRCISHSRHGRSLARGRFCRERAELCGRPGPGVRP